jgi:hypothetical protein
MKLERIDINSIDFSDERFRISSFSSLESMVLSIEKIGLINPLLVALRDGGLILVSGWKRAISCQKLSLSPIPVFRIEENDDLSVFKIAFFENLASISSRNSEKKKRTSSNLFCRFWIFLLPGFILRLTWLFLVLKQS